MTGLTRREKERLQNALFIFTIMVAFFALGAVTVAAQHWHDTDPAKADWTVAPCSWWADTEFPKLPPYTVPNLCVTPSGTIIKAGQK